MLGGFSYFIGTVSNPNAHFQIGAFFGAVAFGGFTGAVAGLGSFAVGSGSWKFAGDAILAHAAVQVAMGIPNAAMGLGLGRASTNTAPQSSNGLAPNMGHVGVGGGPGWVNPNWIPGSSADAGPYPSGSQNPLAAFSFGSLPGATPIVYSLCAVVEGVRVCITVW